MFRAGWQQCWLGPCAQVLGVVGAGGDFAVDAGEFGDHIDFGRLGQTNDVGAHDQRRRARGWQPQNFSSASESVPAPVGRTVPTLGDGDLEGIESGANSITGSVVVIG